MTAPRTGDRVRVVLEGEVTATAVSTSDFWLEGKRLYLSGHAVKSVEVLAPPVEVFGPGTTVRHKRSGRLFTVGEGRNYWSHQLHVRGQSSEGHFNSQDYERVDLS